MTKIIAVLVMFSGAVAAQPTSEKREQDVFTIALPPPIAAGHTFDFVSSEMELPGKAVKGAPYSAEGVTEKTQRLADGNRISQKNSTVLHRDSEGRTRREVTLGSIGPWASSMQGGAKMIFIHDPVEGVSYTLNETDKTARKLPGNAMMMSFSKMSAAGSAGPGEMGVAINRRMIEEKVTEKMVIANGKVLAHGVAGVRVPGPNAKNSKTESLGKRNIEGVEAEGTRSTFTIPAGEIGNELPIDVVSERWYSNELQTVVMTRYTDPRDGETVYRLSNLRRGEPSRQLFEVPSDYKVITEEMPRMIPRKLRNEK